MIEDKVALRRSRRDLISANNLVSWGAIGLFFPIIGIIISIMVQNKLNYVIEDDDNSEKIDEIRSSANLWIIASIIAGVMWALLFAFLSDLDQLY